MKILLHQPNHSAASYYRVVLPSRYLKSLTCKQDLYGDYNAYILHSSALTKYLVEKMKYEKRRGKTFVFSVDDNVFYKENKTIVPPWNMSYEHYEKQDTKDCLKWCVENAESVITSTQELSDFISHPKKYVLPNLVDLDDWNTESGVVWGKSGVRILWAGSKYHYMDLKQIIEPVKSIVNIYSNVTVYFMGCAPEELIGIHPRIKYLEGLEIKDYQSVTKHVIKPDIALAPLVDVEFNHSKSNLKYLEMTMTGAATIASDLTPYHCIDDGVDGILVKEDGWLDAMRKLVENVELRKEMAGNAYSKVCNNYSWQSASKPWVDFEDDLLAIDKVKMAS